MSVLPTTSQWHDRISGPVKLKNKNCYHSRLTARLTIPESLRLHNGFEWITAKLKARVADWLVC